MAKNKRVIENAHKAFDREYNRLLAELAGKETVSTLAVALLLKTAYIDGYREGYRARGSEHRANSEKTHINPLSGEIAAESEADNGPDQSHV